MLKTTSMRGSLFNLSTTFLLLNSALVLAEPRSLQAIREELTNKTYVISQMVQDLAHKGELRISADLDHFEKAATGDLERSSLPQDWSPSLMAGSLKDQARQKITNDLLHQHLCDLMHQMIPFSASRKSSAATESFLLQIYSLTETKAGSKALDYLRSHQRLPADPETILILRVQNLPTLALTIAPQNQNDEEMSLLSLRLTYKGNAIPAEIPLRIKGFARLQRHLLEQLFGAQRLILVDDSFFLDDSRPEDLEATLVQELQHLYDFERAAIFTRSPFRIAERKLLESRASALLRLPGSQTIDTEELIRSPQFAGFVQAALEYEQREFDPTKRLTDAQISQRRSQITASISQDYQSKSIRLYAYLNSDIERFGHHAQIHYLREIHSYKIDDVITHFRRTATIKSYMRIPSQSLLLPLAPFVDQYYRSLYRSESLIPGRMTIAAQKLLDEGSSEGELKIIQLAYEAVEWPQKK